MAPVTRRKLFAHIAAAALMLAVLEMSDAVATADGQSGPAALAACSARRWLARNAAGVKLIRSQTDASASACVSLVSFLPALEGVDLSFCNPVFANDLGCLLEALAWCPRAGVGWNRSTGTGDR